MAMAVRPRCPPHLSAEGKREWKRIVPELASLGLLTLVDRAALALYCQAWARWVDAEKKLEEFGNLVKTPSGFAQQSPYLAIANKAMEQMGKFLAEFGMSPASRTRVTATQKPVTEGNRFALLKRVP